MKHDSTLDGLQLSEQLCFALYCASRKVIQSYQPHLQEMGVTYPQYLVLLVLWENDGLTVKAIGEQLMLDSGTLTPLLKRMASSGLIRREHDEKDERQRRIYLTDAGQALREAAVAMRRDLKCQYGAQLADTDELRSTLQRLLKALN